MIHDSIPWRNDLDRIARDLRRRARTKRWTERSGYLVERDLLTGMFAIRRLIDSHKCSTRLPKRRLPVRQCELTGAEPDLMDRWSPWEHYDLENLRGTELDVWSMTQQFIHSYILMLDFDEANDLSGVFVGSDRTKRSQLYWIGLDTLEGLFGYVATEDVVHLSLIRSGTPTDRLALSQHDLVEAGFGTYDGASRQFVNYGDVIEDGELRAAFPELDEFAVTRFRVPNWSDRGHTPEDP